MTSWYYYIKAKNMPSHIRRGQLDFCNVCVCLPRYRHFRLNWTKFFLNHFLAFFSNFALKIAISAYFVTGLDFQSSLMSHLIDRFGMPTPARWIIHCIILCSQTLCSINYEIHDSAVRWRSEMLWSKIKIITEIMMI